MARGRDRRSLSYSGPEPWHVYALLDPRDKSTRYVGSSFNPHARVGAHWNTPTAKMRAWIYGLRRLGTPPTLQILATFPSRAAAMAHEESLIASMASRGVGLLNDRSLRSRRAA